VYQKEKLQERIVSDGEIIAIDYYLRVKEIHLKKYSLRESHLFVSAVINPFLWKLIISQLKTI
jgi:hypothetical protein